MIGHSFGGLVARMAVYLLVKQYDKSLLKNFNFVGYYSMASPHLGVRFSTKKTNGMIDYVFKKGVGFMLNWKGYGLSGQEMMINDSEKIMEKMCFKNFTDHSLQKFKHKTLVGCTHHDYSVCFSTACIENGHSFDLPKYNKSKFVIRDIINFDSSHTYIHKCYKKNSSSSKKKKKMSNNNKKFVSDSNNILEYSKDMYRKLNGLKFRKIFIQFQVGSKTPKMFPVHLFYIHKMKCWVTGHHYEKQESKKFIDFFLKLILFDHGI